MNTKLWPVILCILFARSNVGQKSYCPDVLTVEPPEPGPNVNRRYGNIKLITDTTLQGLWLTIELDSPAELVGNWIAEVKSKDNLEFRINDPNTKIVPSPTKNVRFFVKYDAQNIIPNVVSIKLNGRVICAAPPNSGPLTVHTAVSSGGGSSSFDSLTGVLTQSSWKSTNAGRAYSFSNSSVFVPDTISFIQTLTTPSTTTTTASCIGCDAVVEDTYDENAPINEDEYFDGGLPTARELEEAHNTRQIGNSNTASCGVVLKKPNPLIINGRQTKAGEWPWQVALFLTRSFETRYACGGTLITLKYVTTAAHCVTRRKTKRVVPRSTITLYMGKHNLRTTIDGVQIRYVALILVHKDFDPTTFNQDLALMKLQEPVSYTDTVRPACLWPQEREDLSYVIGQRGTVVGWGYDGTGKTSEELTLVEMPVVAQDVCVRSHPLFFGKFTSVNTYCAGYRNGSSACNGDSGGGMVFNLNGVWHIRGLVSLSVAKSREQHTCDPNHFIIFTDIAKSLNWIKDVVIREEQQSYTKLFNR